MWLRPKGARRYFAEGIIKTEDRTKMPLSVAIIARNEEERLPDCLRSVRFADDVVVVDSGSVDNTVQIAKSFGARVFVREWMGFSGQKQFAVDQCRHDWVLILDADERVPEETAILIQREVAAEAQVASAFSIKRKNLLYGRWIEHCGWWPDRIVRLVNKNDGRFDGRAVHEKWLSRGNVGKLDVFIEHRSFRNCSELVDKMENYSSLAAEELFKKGQRANATTPVFHGVWMFIKTYFLEMGLLDGFEGFLISCMNAGGSFLKYAKLREKGLAGNKRGENNCL
jgi:glycosyltransferase involved in cell wall biosynthesis